MHSSQSLLFVGNPLLDVVCHRATWTLEIGVDHEASIEQRRGGSAATSAITVAGLGGAATLLGRVGADEIGRQLREECRVAGVDVGFLSEVGSTALIVVLVDLTGERTMVNDPHVANDLGPPFPLIACGGVALNCRSLGDSANDWLDQWLIELCPPFVLADLSDPCYAGLLSPERVAHWSDGGTRVVIRGTAAEVAVWRDLGGGSSQADVIATNGGGPMLVLENGVEHSIAVETVDCLDTTGAGDLLTGALAHFLEATGSLRRAASAACGHVSTLLALRAQ